MPVTVTWNVPADVNVQDSVEVPDPVTLVGDTEQDVLLVARLTTPANPFRPVTVMVDVAAVPGVKLTRVGVPAVANVQDSVELPDPVTVAGETVHDVLFVARLTTPEKPFWAATVIVEVPAAPALIVTVVGLAVTVKSVDVKVTVTE